MPVLSKGVKPYIEVAWIKLLKLTGKYKQWSAKRQLQIYESIAQPMMAMYGQFVSQGSLCFDVGANKGSRVNVFLKLGARVIAIEPQAECVGLLQKRFSDQGVVIVQKGVGSNTKTQELFVSDNSSISSFNREWIGNMKKIYTKRNWDKVEKVEMTTLDELIKKYGIPDFIKIDTEGFETEVLKGLSVCVPALSFEYTLPFHKEQAIKSLKLLDVLYGDNGVYHICRDEAYTLDSNAWISNAAMRSLLESNAFTSEQYGMYGDIYVKRISPV